MKQTAAKPSSERLSRKEAIAQGLRKYWPITVCGAGHDAMRRVSGPCVTCELVAKRKWKSSFPEIAKRSSHSEWAKKNPDRHRQNSAKWIKANPWYAVASVNARRVKKRGAAGNYTKGDIDAILVRQGGICASCGSDQRLEVDHIVPISKGGSNWPENLQVLCRGCNARKSSKTPKLSDCSSHGQNAS